jgi:hypothetical protein
MGRLADDGARWDRLLPCASIAVAFRPTSPSEFNGPPGQQRFGTWLGCLGALSGLTRLSALSLRDRTPVTENGELMGIEEEAGVLAPEALLAALPSSPSLATVRGCEGLRCCCRGVRLRARSRLVARPFPPSPSRTCAARPHLASGRGESRGESRVHQQGTHACLVVVAELPVPPSRPAPPLLMQLELQPVNLQYVCLDVALTSRFPRLERLALHDTRAYEEITASATLGRDGADVVVGGSTAYPADAHGWLQGLLDGFILPRCGLINWDIP